MNGLKQKLLTNWHAGRILRMVAGLMLAYVAIDTHDVLMGLFSAFFLFLALTGAGCCGTAGCYVPPAGKRQNGQTTTHEEIK